MKRKIEHISVFLMGGILYSIIEIIWRGYTHWSMTAVGGVCFLLLYMINCRLKNRNFFMRCLVGTGIITVVEFAAGVMVNLILRLDVWDYSMLRFNILGQVSLLFSVLWFALCIPAYMLSTGIRVFFESIELEEDGEAP